LLAAPVVRGGAAQQAHAQTAPAVQAAPPALELRVGGTWLPWRAFEPGAPAVRDTQLERATTWRDRAPGVAVGAFEVRTRGYLWTNSVAIVAVDPRVFLFAIDAPPDWARRTAEEALADSGIVLAVNTGLFRKNGTPQGLVLDRGRRRSALAGWLDAVVVVEDGRLRVTDIEGARTLGEGASAFQTLPWLVREGRVVLGVTSGVRLSRDHRDRRFTLCLEGDGSVRFLLSNFEVFGQAAGRVPVGLTIPEQAVIAAAAGCRDAVALDGGISAQLVVRGSARVHRMPGWRRVPLLMVARRR
jgi:uncharacterized protein YigE (DUF2233 family)